ncbi:MAG: hypothetical protein IPJ98_12380 [Bryobacterales bacterium]|nr:hypothetical protein [Bryobacterales bacterium]
MRDKELRETMAFQLSLLRLVTAPHKGNEPVPGKVEGEEQLERLVQLAAYGYQH